MSGTGEVSPSVGEEELGEGGDNREAQGRERGAGRITFGRNFGNTDQWVSQKDPTYCEQTCKQDSTNTDLIDLRKFLEDDDRELEVRRGKREDLVEKQK